jgi:hypothetical protein
VQVVTWLAAVVLATGLGLLAVSVVGDAARGRGPLGDVVTGPGGPASTMATSTPVDDGRESVREHLTDDYGTFTVSCRGPWATGMAATPGQGWRVVRFEPGPDDDVEAVFASEAELVEVEVFCNRGRPTVAEVDRSRIAGSD